MKRLFKCDQPRVLDARNSRESFQNLVGFQRGVCDVGRQGDAGFFVDGRALRDGENIRVQF